MLTHTEFIKQQFLLAFARAYNGIPYELVGNDKDDITLLHERTSPLLRLVIGRDGACTVYCKSVQFTEGVFPEEFQQWHNVTEERFALASFSSGDKFKADLLTFQNKLRAVAVALHQREL